MIITKTIIIKIIINECYLSLTRKDFVGHMQSLAVYVMEGLPLACDLSIGNSGNYYLYFRLT